MGGSDGCPRERERQGDEGLGREVGREAGREVGGGREGEDRKEEGGRKRRGSQSCKPLDAQLEAVAEEGEGGGRGRIGGADGGGGDVSATFQDGSKGGGGRVNRGADEAS